MLNTQDGTPVTGYVSLTNGATGPTAFTLYVNGAAYTLPTGYRVYITNMGVSTNDTTLELVTVDTGGASPTKLASVYVMSAANFSLISLAYPLGTCRGNMGIVPRATASAVTAAKSIEITLTGYVARV